MTIKDVLSQLAALRNRYGEDVEIISDCKFCGKETRPNKIVPEPIKVKLTEKE